MSILQNLKDDQVHTRKHVNELAEYKTVVSILTTLIGEASMIGKNDGNRETTDDEVIVVMKKFLKGMNDSLAIRQDDGIELEKKIIEEYLERYGPKMLSEADVDTIIVEFIAVQELTSPRDMGKVMAMLKANHAGTYDGAYASKSAKQHLMS